jgi:S1-C subfamily serine protease
LLIGSLCVLGWLALPAAAQETTAVGTPEERAAALTRPSVVYIEQYFRAWVRVPRTSDLIFTGYVNGGNPFEWATRCSGFVVNPDGYVVSAGHCVDLGEEGARETALQMAVQWLIDDGWAFQEDFDFWLNEAHLTWGVEGTERGSDPDLEVWVQRGVAAGGLQTGEALPARVVSYQPWSEGDIAILKVEQSDMPTLLLAASADVTIGTPVLSVGYPGSSDEVTDQSLEPTFKDGQINSEKTREGGLLPVYEMSAALSGGMSGGPTVNLEGEVVGVNSFNITGETEAFNFISPVSLVSELMAQNGVANELGPVDEAYRAGIDAYFAGDYTTAIEQFEQVIALSPTHQLATEYRTLAARAQAENPTPTGAPDEGESAAGAEDEGGGFPVWAIAAIAGGVLLVVLLVVLTRRKPSAPAPAPVAATSVPAAPPEARPAVAVGFQPPPPVTGTASEPEPTRAAEPAPPSTGPAAGPTMHFCPNCGQEVQPGARFCASCGHALG